MRATTRDLTAAVWRRSSYSNTGGGECVEVADGFPGAVPVRDSKSPGYALVIPEAAWSAFVERLKR
jgi:hypothetical protein